MDIRSNLRRMLKRTKSGKTFSSPESPHLSEPIPAAAPSTVTAKNDIEEPPLLSLITTDTTNDIKKQVVPVKVRRKRSRSSLDSKSPRLQSVREDFEGPESDGTNSVDTLPRSNHSRGNLVDLSEKDKVALKQRLYELSDSRPVVTIQEPSPGTGDVNVGQPFDGYRDTRSSSEDTLARLSPRLSVDGAPKKISASSSVGSFDQIQLPPSTVRLPIPPSSPNRLHSPNRTAALTAVQPREERIETSTTDTEEQDNHQDPSDTEDMSPAVVYRKVWVKRAGASPTLVQIREHDLVDDARDMILKKYANSLGRSYDSPDVLLRIVTATDGQPGQQERYLGPEEDLSDTLDRYYPKGQSVEEALIIDIPPRRTPKPSPRAHPHHTYAAVDDNRPHESGTDYFPPMPAVITPTLPQHVEGRINHSLHLPDHARSLSVLTTGQVPPLPSPGATSRRHREHRPRIGRQHTSSPTIINHQNPSAVPAAAVMNPAALASTQSLSQRPSARARHESIMSDRSNAAVAAAAPAPPPLPTPPAPEAPPTNNKTASTPPTPLAREHTRRPRRSRKPTPTNGTATVKAGGIPVSMLDGSVPPINVLIVEDNIINLKLLEAFMKRLKVRWSTAMNGQIAVNKWKAGGFHLVLMDIQLPIMSGLDATKEIRRLERINNIGVFSSTEDASSTPMTNDDGEKTDGVQTDGVTRDEQPTKESGDKLSKEEGLFKSPVIIVALTASSLQSDRHEALAAGCNDFLTKPVNFVWMERKVKEWGCMQALIDFDGWRKWKDFNGPSASGQDTGVGKTTTSNSGKTAPNGGLAKSPTIKSAAGSTAPKSPTLGAAMDGSMTMNGGLSNGTTSTQTADGQQQIKRSKREKRSSIDSMHNTGGSAGSANTVVNGRKSIGDNNNSETNGHQGGGIRA